MVSELWQVGTKSIRICKTEDQLLVIRLPSDKKSKGERPEQSRTSQRARRNRMSKMIKLVLEQPGDDCSHGPDDIQHLSVELCDAGGGDYFVITYRAVGVRFVKGICV